MMIAKKCPSCGAPVSGLTCTYCGLSFAEEQQKQAEPSPPQGKTLSVTTEVRETRTKRSLLDKILIFLGGMWVLVVMAAAANLKYWSSGTEIAAVLVAAAPGILFLLVGFRKKKVIIKATREDG